MGAEKSLLEKAECGLFLALLYPFYVALRFGHLVFFALMGIGVLLHALGLRYVAIYVIVGAVVVSALNLGATLERARMPYRRR